MLENLKRVFGRVAYKQSQAQLLAARWAIADLLLTIIHDNGGIPHHWSKKYDALAQSVTAERCKVDNDMTLAGLIEFAFRK